MDPYKVLGVPKTATREEVTRAYRKKALEWHPDRNPHRKAQADQRFKEIANAYEILSDATKRAQYDAGRFGDGGFQGFQQSPEDLFKNVFGTAECPPPPIGWAILKLLCALIIDFIGVATFLIPGVGEFADAMWAPVSAWLIKQIFDDSLFSTLGLLEELLPLTDLIPTATLCWGRQYWRFIPGWLFMAYKEARD